MTRSRSSDKFAVSLVAGLLVAGIARADTTSFTGILDLVSGPRSNALGGSGTAAAGDESLSWTNPAAPAALGHTEISSAVEAGFAGVFIGGIAGSMNLPPFQVTSGLAYSDAGSLSIAQLDGSTKKIAAQRDEVGAIGFSLTAASGLTAGFALKVVHSELFETYGATALAVDVGAQWAATDGLRVGVAQLNSGRGLLFHTTRVALPTTWRAGVALGQPEVLQGMLDVSYRLADGQTIGMAGLEWPCTPRFILRAGGQVISGVSSPSAAAGFSFALDQLSIEYAIRFATSDFIPPQQIGLRFML